MSLAVGVGAIATIWLIRRSLATDHALALFPGDFATPRGFWWRKAVSHAALSGDMPGSEDCVVGWDWLLSTDDGQTLEFQFAWRAGG